MQKSLMMIETLSLHFIWCFSSHWSTWQLSVHLSVYKLGLLFDFIMSNFCQNESFAFLLILFNKLHISSHQNKKALSPFYHKKYFWLKMNVRNKRCSKLFFVFCCCCYCRCVVFKKDKSTKQLRWVSRVRFCGLFQGLISFPENQEKVEKDQWNISK